MIFDNYFNLPQEPLNSHAGDIFAPELGEASIEQPIIGIRDMGQSVTESSRAGNLIKTATEAIRHGVGLIELGTGLGGGGDPVVGAENYGRDARQALRELARANDISYTSIHTPTQIGNMSGYNPQRNRFDDEQRLTQVEEVKKAIKLAADVGGGGVVVHTGEFQRDISDQPWARNSDGTYKFLGYKEEPGRAVLYMVDDRTGRLLGEVRKSNVLHEPDFEMKYDSQQKRMRYVDVEGTFLEDGNVEDLFRRVPKWDDTKTYFKTHRVTWDDFIKRANEWNSFFPKEDGTKWKPEELYFRLQQENQILQAKGSSLFHGRFYKNAYDTRDSLLKALAFVEKVEKTTPEEEQWKLMEDILPPDVRSGIAAKYVERKKVLPSEAIKIELRRVTEEMKYIHEASASADARAKESEETMMHTVPVENYAKELTAQSYAEAGIYAMEESKSNRFVKKDVFVAPENLFPEMGYGTHPDELIELVQGARKRMVELLTEKEIFDPHKRDRDETGMLKKVANPWYSGINRREAEEIAKKHIKATFDTQHLGMWWKQFQPMSGETVDQRRNRFDKWYMQQVEKLSKADIIGHIHAVDSMGSGHHHLPVGQGIFPVKEALEYLKKKGFKGTMVSEGWHEDVMFSPGRIVSETWRNLGSPIGRGAGFGGFGAPVRWGDVQQSYFNQMQAPYFIFGNYAPSNDWQLWSQMPME